MKGGLSVSEKPILFSGAMVQAIQDGRKTQTRRIIDFKKIAKQSGSRSGKLAYSDTFKSWAVFGGSEADVALVNCPYGKIGDTLWVRETHSVVPVKKEFALRDNDMGVIYKADGDEAFEKIKDGWQFSGQWTPSIHMFRWASRITLQTKNIRVERLQDISEDDARAEGVVPYTATSEPFPNYVAAFADLWDSLNESRGFGWEVNPFVCVIEFEKQH